MYEDIAVLFLAEEDQEEDDLHNHHQHLLACLALVGYGILESRRIRMHRCRLSQHYLCRPDLLPNPRESTPWQQLYTSGSDKAFITVMGLDIKSFHYILGGGFTSAWAGNAIPRPDMNLGSAPRIHRRSLDAAGALALALHHITTTVPSHSLSLIFALVHATVHRYLNFALSILLSTLKTLTEARITWPKDREFGSLNELIVRRHPLLTGAFGSMDGLNIGLRESTDEEFANSTYNGWLHTRLIANVFVFAPTGVSIYLFTFNVLNCSQVRSWHANLTRPAVGTTPAMQNKYTRNFYTRLPRVTISLPTPPSPAAIPESVNASAYP
jgi:hypothetical protein